MSRREKSLSLLKAEYRRKLRENAPQRELAEAESELWHALPDDERRAVHGIGSWFAANFDTSSRSTQERMYLLNAKHAGRLWKQIELRKLTLGIAVELHRNAKAYNAAHGVGLERTVRDVLGEYFTLPVQRVEDGIKIHKRSQSKFARTKRAPGVRIAPPTKRAEFPTTQLFLSWVKRGAESYARSRLNGDINGDAERLVAELHADLKDLLNDWAVRVTSAQAKAKRTKIDHEDAVAVQGRISRRRFVDACQRLRMPAPGVGKAVNLDLAKKQKRKLSREYHPDLHQGGTEHTRAEFEAIVEAYRIVEQYAEQIPTGKEVNANGTT